MGKVIDQLFYDGSSSSITVQKMREHPEHFKEVGIWSRVKLGVGGEIEQVLGEGRLYDYVSEEGGAK